MVSSSSKHTLSKTAAKGKKFGIVAARYHEEITSKLVDGALQTLKDHGAEESDITTVWVPGSFEIPVTARIMAQHLDPDAVLCFGVIVKGETPHNVFIANEVARGIGSLSLTAGLPVIFGILTPDTLEQAKARVGGDKGHKGIEAALTAIEMADTLERLEEAYQKHSGNVGFGSR